MTREAIEALLDYSEAIGVARDAFFDLDLPAEALKPIGDIVRAAKTRLLDVAANLPADHAAQLAELAAKAAAQ